MFGLCASPHVRRRCTARLSAGHALGCNPTQRACGPCGTSHNCFAEGEIPPLGEGDKGSGIHFSDCLNQNHAVVHVLLTKSWPFWQPVVTIPLCVTDSERRGAAEQQSGACTVTCRGQALLLLLCWQLMHGAWRGSKQGLCGYVCCERKKGHRGLQSKSCACSRVVQHVLRAPRVLSCKQRSEAHLVDYSSRQLQQCPNAPHHNNDPTCTIGAAPDYVHSIWQHW